MSDFTLVWSCRLTKLDRSSYPAFHKFLHEASRGIECEKWILEQAAERKVTLSLRDIGKSEAAVENWGPSRFTKSEINLALYRTWMRYVLC